MAGVTTYTRTEKGFLRLNVLSAPQVIAATAVDTGNTGQTHILRSGLVLARLSADGTLTDYLDGSSGGREVAYAILLQQVDLKDGDPSATATAHPADVLLIGVVDSAGLIGYDAAAKVDLQVPTGAGLAPRIWFVS